MMEAQRYSWYEDADLHALLDRYISVAVDGAAAGRHLKLWLGTAGNPSVCPPRAPRSPNAPRVAKSQLNSHVAAAVEGQVWLTRNEAAEHLGVTPKTLANWANDPDGPPYRKKGGVRYRMDLLEAWNEKNLR